MKNLLVGFECGSVLSALISFFAKDPNAALAYIALAAYARYARVSK